MPKNSILAGLAEAADPYFFFFMIGLQLRRDSKDYVNGMSWSDGSPVDFGGNISGGAGGVGHIKFKTKILIWKP